MVPPPRITYHGSDTDVRIGDHVEFKVWLFFWKGWQPGRVHYVPGVSPKNADLEFNGLSWVSVHDEHGGQTGIVVDPKTTTLKNSVRFVKRAEDEFVETARNYRFGDDATSE